MTHSYALEILTNVHYKCFLPLLGGAAIVSTGEEKMLKEQHEKYRVGKIHSARAWVYYICIAIVQSDTGKYLEFGTYSIMITSA